MPPVDPSRFGTTLQDALHLRIRVHDDRDRRVNWGRDFPAALGSGDGWFVKGCSLVLSEWRLIFFA
jgi:hypothetical protein